MLVRFHGSEQYGKERQRRQGKGEGPDRRKTEVTEAVELRSNSFFKIKCIVRSEKDEGGVDFE
jgi:hypothetical protein